MARLSAHKVKGQTLVEVIVAITLLALTTGLALWISSRVIAGVSVEKKAEARQSCRQLLESPQLRAGTYPFEGYQVEVFVTPAQGDDRLKLVEMYARDDYREWYSLKKWLIDE
ncbi:prepilin-type N-terminal cleavage/methylation domain-containing protein [bacterium SCSIO 12741]|nr:prepilin-type N-terminal cleavage/methylation domain-containing protein [bacterium SCSIO 12741]